MRLKDMSSSEKLKEVGEKYQQDREAERMRYQLLGEEKEEVADECEQRIGRMEDTHRHALQELENAYQQKIMLEVERYGQLEKEREMSRKRWDERRSTLQENHMAYVSELQQDFERKLTEDKRRVNFMPKRNFEEGAPRGSQSVGRRHRRRDQNLRGKYDAKLADEREASLRYKGENGIMKKKFTVINQQLEEHAEGPSPEWSGRDLKATMRALEKEIAEEKEVI